MKLPENVKVFYIDKESKLGALELLKGCKYVGFDSEFGIDQLEQVESIALLQLATQDAVFLIDTLRLTSFEVLFTKLSQVLATQHLVGFALE